MSTRVDTNAVDRLLRLIRRVHDGRRQAELRQVSCGDQAVSAIVFHPQAPTSDIGTVRATRNGWRVTSRAAHHDRSRCRRARVPDDGRDRQPRELHELVQRERMDRHEVPVERGGIGGAQVPLRSIGAHQNAKRRGDAPAAHRGAPRRRHRGCNVSQSAAQQPHFAGGPTTLPAAGRTIISKAAGDECLERSDAQVVVMATMMLVLSLAVATVSSLEAPDVGRQALTDVPSAGIVSSFVASLPIWAWVAIIAAVIVVPCCLCCVCCRCCRSACCCCPCIGNNDA